MSSISFTRKKEIVSEIENVLLKTCSIVFADYSGLTAKEMDNFRANARDIGVYVKVIPNNLAKLAIKPSAFSNCKNLIKGHMLMICSMNSIPDAVNSIINFNKKSSNKFEVKLICTEGNRIFYDADCNFISKLPNKKDALALLANAIKGKISQFVYLLKMPNIKLLNVLTTLCKLK